MQMAFDAEKKMISAPSRFTSILSLCREPLYFLDFMARAKGLEPATSALAVRERIGLNGVCCYHSMSSCIEPDLTVRTVRSPDSTA